MKAVITAPAKAQYLTGTSLGGASVALPSALDGRGAASTRVAMMSSLKRRVCASRHDIPLFILLVSGDCQDSASQKKNIVFHTTDAESDMLAGVLTAEEIDLRR